MHRTRTCAECGKHLGGTYGTCYECGGSKQVDPPGTQPMYDGARKWKVFLGVNPVKIKAAHGASKERNPRWDDEHEEWKHEL